MSGSMTVKDWDKDYVWHPFTQMNDYMKADPLVIEKGEGFYLVDVDGKRYIDGVSSLWVLVHGHGKQELVDALVKQANRLCHSTLLGIANVPSAELAKKLVDITPTGLTKVFFSDNGSTSVEIALKMAYQHCQQNGRTEKKRFLSFSNGYHGDTIGSVSVGGIDLFHKVYEPLLFRNFKAPSPYCYRCPYDKNPSNCHFGCIEEFESIAKEHHEEICAIVIEPLVQGAAGMILQPPGFLSRVSRVAKEYGLFLIADEVATGFGRTGTMFACEQEGVKPDFLCVAKGITGGYLPLAATLTTDEVFNGFLGEYEEFKTFFHGHTYTGNALGCAVALANIGLFESEGLIEKIQDNAMLLTQWLERFNGLPHVGEVRQKGFMVGIELVEDKNTKSPFAPSEKIGQKITTEARKRGVIIRPLGDVIVLMPPLAIDTEILKELVDTTFDSIATISGV